MPQELNAIKAVLLEQEHRTIGWLSNLNLVEFIRLEIKHFLPTFDKDDFEAQKEQHFAEICHDPECHEVQELANTLIRMMPDPYQNFHCIREDVCAHLMHYCPAALALL